MRARRRGRGLFVKRSGRRFPRCEKEKHPRYASHTTRIAIMSFDSAIKTSLSDVKNKNKRAELFERTKEQASKLRRKNKDKRKRDEEEAAAEGRELPKKIPRTIENTRKADETTVKADDDEVAGDESIDEFAAYYANKQKPKMLITTSNRPRGVRRHCST